MTSQLPILNASDVLLDFPSFSEKRAVDHHAPDAGALRCMPGAARPLAPLVGRIDDTALPLVPPDTEALTLLVTCARTPTSPP